jgi:CO dehydrogenase maturation factor
MKIAISGKGGVGKTLLASLLCREFAGAGYSVLAIDADPNANLAEAMGFPEAASITPLSEMRALIEERTGSGKAVGGFFKLNPRVEDLPEKYSREYSGVRLMVMGGIKKGGSGCYCPENALLQAMVTHLLLERDAVVILDMEAGLEHLGRATARAVDMLIIVVEPGRTSVQTAQRIAALAGDIGIGRIGVVANKVRNETDRAYLTGNLAGFNFLGFIPYERTVVDAELNGLDVSAVSRTVLDEVKQVFQKLTVAT